MNTQVFEGNALPYVLVTPTGFTTDVRYPLVVFLHGFGASMHDLAGIADAIDSAAYVYAFPNAPYRVDLGGGIAGYSWDVVERSVQPVRPGPPAPSGLPPFDAPLQTFLDEVIAQTGAIPGRVVLGGFSQGGGAVLHFGLPRPEAFCGLAALSASFNPVYGLPERLPASRDQSIFLAHGANDPCISVDHARTTKAFLEGAGYAPSYHEYDIAHAIAPQELHDLAAWLHDVLPPQQ